MGYQESFIRIENFAEAAGYKDSIKNRLDDPGFYFYCAARAKKDMYVSPMWGGRPDDPTTKPCIYKDELFAVVGGDRKPYQTGGGMIFSDSIAGLDFGEGVYSDFFEDFDDSVLEDRAKDHPDSRRKAKTTMDEHLDHCWD